jgi:hypothetical protein
MTCLLFQNTCRFGIVCVCVILCAAPVWAQDASATLGKALVGIAGEKTAARDAPPPLPGGEPASGANPIMQFDPATLNPIIAKVNQDALAELARLNSKGAEVPSVMFNPSEQAALSSAIAVYESGNFIKPIDPSELPSDDVVEVKLDDSRNLSLAGISYGDGKNWVVWLNKQRLTPTRLPPQIKGIKVYKHYIEIRWMDDESKNIVPVRLRPNQRFNLDTQTFLPG